MHKGHFLGGQDKKGAWFLWGLKENKKYFDCPNNSIIQMGGCIDTPLMHTSRPNNKINLCIRCFCCRMYAKCLEEGTVVIYRIGHIHHTVGYRWCHGIPGVHYIFAVIRRWRHSSWARWSRLIKVRWMHWVRQGWWSWLSCVRWSRLSLLNVLTTTIPTVLHR